MTTFWKIYPYGAFAVVTASFVFSSIWIGRHQKHVVITEQDEVRYCMNALTDSPRDAKEIHFYCYEFHGFELMDKGVKPNYDKHPKLW